MGPLRAFWREGARLETADRRVRLRLRARFDGDAAFFGSTQQLERLRDEPLENGVEVRRARVGIGGKIGSHFHFKADVDFADLIDDPSESSPELKSVYVGLHDLPGGLTVRLGNLREPFGLERVTSSRYVNFLERSLTTALEPPRTNTAVARWRWQVESFSFSITTISVSTPGVARR